MRFRRRMAFRRRSKEPTYWERLANNFDGLGFTLVGNTQTAPFAFSPFVPQIMFGSDALDTTYTVLRVRIDWLPAFRQSGNAGDPVAMQFGCTLGVYVGEVGATPLNPLLTANNDLRTDWMALSSTQSNESLGIVANIHPAWPVHLDIKTKRLVRMNEELVIAVQGQIFSSSAGGSANVSMASMFQTSVLFQRHLKR